MHTFQAETFRPYEHTKTTIARKTEFLSWAGQGRYAPGDPPIERVELHRLLKMPEEGNAGKIRDSIIRERRRDDLTNVGGRRSGCTATLQSDGTKTYKKAFLPCSPSECQAVHATCTWV